MAFDIKQFLDFQGLKEYDELIKKYIGEEAGSNETVQALVNSLATLTQQVATDEEQIGANAGAIEVLNGDSSVEGSVANQVQNAVSDLVNGAPEALDTLKEIADWIKADEAGAAALAEQVAENKKAIEDNKAYADAQYASISRVEEVQIASLFPVKQAANQTAVEAIAAVEEGRAVKLNAGQTIAENVAIEKSCYIDANGSTFTGTVTVPADADVIIENATFAQPVVVA